jgi:hypothetical protein
MKRSIKYIDPDMQSRKLSEEEANDPHSVIESFFEYATLPQAKDKLWVWLEATVTGSFCKELNCRERCNMVFFYSHVEKLMEAVHIIHEKHKTKRSLKK